jgi:hypothetical protein
MFEPIRKNEPIKAIETIEGFIEITSLTELDEIVGGFDAESFLCELEEQDNRYTES